MAKAVKKIKTTYEAVQWEGLNEQEFDGWGVTYFRDDRWSEATLTAEFYDESSDRFFSHCLSPGDAIVRSSKGRTWMLRKDEYERKFRDA